MPVYDALINVTDSSHILLATEFGIWSTHLEYIDYAGNKQSVPVMKKSSIPKGVKSTLTKLNFCTNREK